MIRINGIDYDVGITDIQRGEHKEYKYDLIAEDGTKRREIRSRYRTYTVTFGNANQAQYDALHAAVANNDASSEVTLLDGQEYVTIEVSIEIGDDAIGFIERDGTIRWDGLVITMTGINPLADGE